MSSEEFEYEYDSDELEDANEGILENDQGSNNSTNNDPYNDLLINIENTFYEADDVYNELPVKAIELYSKVVQLEKDLGNMEIENGKSTGTKWTFSALERIVLLHAKQNAMADMLKALEKLVDCISQVTRNECHDTITRIVENSKLAQATEYTELVYALILDALAKAKYERLWFHVKVKLAKLYLECRDFEKMQRVLGELHREMDTQMPTLGSSSGAMLATQRLEVSCLEIQYCRATENYEKLKMIYPATLDLDGTIADPRIMGIIREEGGKMHMYEYQWTLAYNEFFQAFRNYQETGNARAKDCLKYVVLASMLASSDINPFDSREAKVYKDESEIQAMINLRGAYEAYDIHGFEKSMAKLKKDDFMQEFIDPLVRNLRLHVLTQLVIPYRTVQLAYLASEMNIDQAMVESLVAELILNGTLKAQIDQVNQTVSLRTKEKGKDSKMLAIDQWTSKLALLQCNIQNRLVLHQGNFSAMATALPSTNTNRRLNQQ